MTRRYVDALVAHREREMIIGGLWVISGFEQIAVPFKKGSRPKTSYGLARKAAQAVNAVTSFSDRPLIFILYLAVGILAFSGVAGIAIIVRHLFFGALLAGWPSLIVSVWLLGGLTLFAIGILGIYLSKVFVEVKQRPYTIVREIHDRTAELNPRP
jgi:putative glycosyltransferase